MSDIPLSEVLEISPDVSEGVARDNYSALVSNGLMPIGEANAKLAARGAAPLNPNSTELAQVEYDRLIRDPNTINDPAALARATMLGLRIQKGGGKLTDAAPKAEDYNFAADLPRMPGETGQEVSEYHDGLANLSADLKLSPAIAKSFVNEHLNACEREATMSADEREVYGWRQEADLCSVLGPNAEARLKAASATLKQMSGRDLDLLKIVRSNGAAAAVTLLFQAETWAATRGRTR